MFKISGTLRTQIYSGWVSQLQRRQGGEAYRLCLIRPNSPASSLARTHGNFATLALKWGLLNRDAGGGQSNMILFFAYFEMCFGHSSAILSPKLCLFQFFYITCWPNIVVQPPSLGPHFCYLQVSPLRKTVFLCIEFIIQKNTLPKS